MLPAPKNSLCLAPTAASRRSASDSGVPASDPEGFERRQERSSFGSSKAESFEGGEQERGSFVVEYGSYPLEQGASGYKNYGEQQERNSFEEYGNYTLEQGVSGYENYGGYDGNWAASGSVDSSYGTESGGGNYGGYASNWSNGGAVAVAAPAVSEMERIVGKRGRNEIPAEIVEVNQAELIKNRPREDQVKLTGIAFGPAYQEWARMQYLAKHHQLASQQWGNLYYYRMQNIRGFGTVAWIDVKEYESLQPDKIAVDGGEKNLKELDAFFSKSLREILCTEEDVDDAAFISVDSKGTDIRVRQGAQFNIQRLSFEVDRKVETLEETKEALQKIINRGLKS